MNERIKDLCLQAGFIGENMYPAFGTCQETALNNLVELIVRECADFVDAGEFGDPGTAKMLMEDFGVEE